MTAPPSLCRLCITTSHDNFKSLYDEHGQANDLYEMTYEYFHPKIVDLEKAKHLTVICLECFRHIHDFHSFQSSVIIAQLKLIEEEKTIYTIAEKVESPQRQIPTQTMAIKVEEEEFIGFTPEYFIETDCPQIMKKEFITLPDRQIDDSAPSTSKNYNQTIESLSIRDTANVEEDRKDNISLPPLEIIDVDTGSTFTSGDEISLVSIHARNQTLSENPNPDGVDTTKTIDDQNPSSDQPRKKYDICHSKWIPNVKCFQCSKSFPSWLILQNHFKKQHPNEKPYYICCSLKFNKLQIRNHLLLHDNPEALTCSICNKRYINSTSLASHYTESHPESVKFPCDKCDKRCITKQGLAKHYEKIHSSTRQDLSDLQIHHTPPPTTNTGNTGIIAPLSITNDEEDQQDEIPSAQGDDAINSGVTKSRSADGADTKTIDNQKSSHDLTQNEYKSFENLLTKWIPNIKCFQCSTSFPSWTLVKTHFKEQHPDEKFHYICCTRKFSRCQIKDHLCLHEDPEAFKCSICDRLYNGSGNLSSHFSEKHPESLKFQCDKCKKRFVSNHGLTQHHLKKHSSGYNEATESLSIQDLTSYNSDEVEDGIDNRSRPTLEIMDADSGDQIPLTHIDASNSSVTKSRSADDVVTEPIDNQKSSHNQPQKNLETLDRDYLLAKWLPNIKCFKCSKAFSSWSFVEVHFKQQHPNEEFFYKCCSRKFKRLKIKEHLLLHDNPDRFKCSICGKCFKANKNLVAHCNERHPDSLKFPCDKCKNRYMSNNALAIHHRKMHSSDKDNTEPTTSSSSDPVVTQTIDHQISSYQNNYEILENLLAKWIPNIKCFKCSKLYPSWPLLKSHFKHRHPNEKFYYLCCMRKFSNDAIKDHLRLHEDPDAFKCSLCDKRYASNASLGPHYNEKHSKKYEIQCDKCSKRFKSNHALSIHQRMMHTSNGQYHPDWQIDHSAQPTSKDKNATAIALSIQDPASQKVDVEEHGKDNLTLSKIDLCPQPMSEGNNETTELLSIPGTVFHDKDEEEDRKDNIALPPLEIMDVDTGSAFSSEDEIPLAQMGDRNPSSLSSDAIVTQTSYDPSQENPETLDYLLAKWIPKIKCFKCLKSFPSWSRAKSHFRHHHPNERFYYKCCSRKFKKSMIKDHLRLHGDPDAFKCLICDKHYNSSKNFLIHNTETHIESCNFSCDICGKRFMSELGLNYHSKIHNSNRNDHAKVQVLADGRTAYNCQLCGETKYSKSDFLIHKSKKHGIKTSKKVCTVCGKRCLSDRTYREHMASHENKQLYKCAFCPRTFGKIRPLKVHRKWIHPLESDTNYYVNIGENTNEQRTVDDSESESNDGSTSAKSTAAAPTEKEDCGEDHLPIPVISTADQQDHKDNKKMGHTTMAKFKKEDISTDDETSCDKEI